MLPWLGKSLVWIGSSQTTSSSREGRLNNSKVQKPFCKTLLFMVSAFNILNLLLSKISRIYFLWFYQFDSILFRLQIFYVVSVLLCSDAMKPFIASSIWIQALWNPFLEILEIFMSIINPSLFISNLLHSHHFISRLNFNFIEMLLQTSSENKILMEQVKRVCDTI